MIWANCPNAAVTIRNHQTTNWSGPLRWTNVMPGSVLISRGSVGEGTAGPTGNLSVPVAMAGGGTGSWSLRPREATGGKVAFTLNVGKAWKASHAAGRAPRFAIAVGGTSLGTAMTIIRGSGHPTYLLAGLKDDSTTVRNRLGTAWGSFSWQGQHFFLLDNRHHHLGRTQLAWLERQVHTAKSSGSKRTWVVLQRPPVVPGGRGPDGLDDRREARKVARLLRGLPGVQIVAGHLRKGTLRRWSGLDVALVGPGEILWGDLFTPTAKPLLEKR